MSYCAGYFSNIFAVVFKSCGFNFAVISANLCVVLKYDLVLSAFSCMHVCACVCILSKASQFGPFLSHLFVIFLACNLWPAQTVFI